MPPIAKKRYLVCVNEKEHSKTALFYACTNAKNTASVVDMLYVIDPVDYNTIFSVADVIKEERRNDAIKLFEELQEKAEKWYGMKPNGVIREGIITEEVIKQINDDPNIVKLFLGVAKDGSSNKTNLLSQLTSEIGKEFFVPLIVVPGNLTKEQIMNLNHTNELG